MLIGEGKKTSLLISPVNECGRRKWEEELGRPCYLVVLISKLTCVCARMCVCVCVRVHIYMYVCLCVCIPVYCSLEKSG